MLRAVRAAVLVAAGVFCAQAWGFQDAGTSRGPATVTVTVADRARPISLKRGDTLEVRLESNPSTGYRWSVASVSPVLEQAGNSFERAGAGTMPGASGIDVWRFKAVSRGKQRLRMQYRRPGEKDDDPAAKTIFFQVVVQRER